jgi:hypothetical protein
VSDLKSRVKEAKEVQKRAANLEKDLIYAIVSMEQADAVQVPINASTNISARNVKNVDMERWNAKSMRECEQLGRRPRYLRHNVYHDDDMLSRSCAEWTEIARPLVSVPAVEFSNTLATCTIDRHRGLFTVDTPINVDEFEGLLSNHPNPLFVQSVLKGFRDGSGPGPIHTLESIRIHWMRALEILEMRENLTSFASKGTRR